MAVARGLNVDPKLDQVRTRKRKRFFDESENQPDEESGDVSFRNRILFVAMDRIISEHLVHYYRGDL